MSKVQTLKITAIAVALLLPLATMAMAATTTSTPSPSATVAHHEGKMGAVWIDHTVDLLKQKLALTDAQAKDVHGILEASHKEAMATRQKTQQDVSSLFKAAEARRKATDAKIAAVLTPDQRTKYEANKVAWRQTAMRDEIVGHLKTQLNLNPEQVKSVGDIVAASQQDILKARKEFANDKAKTLDAVRIIHKTTETKIEAVLNPEQKAKYAQMKESWREHKHAWLHNTKSKTGTY